VTDGALNRVSDCYDASDSASRQRSGYFAVVIKAELTIQA